MITPPSQKNKVLPLAFDTGFLAYFFFLLRHKGYRLAIFLFVSAPFLISMLAPSIASESQQQNFYTFRFHLTLFFLLSLPLTACFLSSKAFDGSFLLPFLMAPISRSRVLLGRLFSIALALGFLSFLALNSSYLTQKIIGDEECWIFREAELENLEGSFSQSTSSSLIQLNPEKDHFLQLRLKLSRNLKQRLIRVPHTRYYAFTRQEKSSSQDQSSDQLSERGESGQEEAASQESFVKLAYYDRAGKLQRVFPSYSDSYKSDFFLTDKNVSSNQELKIVIAPGTQRITVLLDPEDVMVADGVESSFYSLGILLVTLFLFSVAFLVPWGVLGSMLFSPAIGYLGCLCLFLIGLLKSSLSFEGSMGFISEILYYYPDLSYNQQHQKFEAGHALAFSSLFEDLQTSYWIISSFCACALSLVLLKRKEF